MATPDTIGFIGVGDLAEYTIIGLRKGGYQGRILLSPRNQTMSAKLASEWHCEVMQDNQAVIDNCAYFFLSTRPADCIEALAGISLHAKHQLISVVAGVTIAQLRETAGEQVQIARAMPVNCAKALASPTLVYPADRTTVELFNICGKSVIADNEEAFNQGSIIACVYTWYFALFEELITACSSGKLPRQLASELIMGMAGGAAGLATQDKDHTPGEIAELIATDGTFSKLGLDMLKEQAAFEPWIKACNELKSRLS